TPSFARQSSMAWVSSLTKAPVRVDSPRARAAQTSARLVMLLEPGGRIVARSGPETGEISITSCIAPLFPLWFGNFPEILMAANVESVARDCGGAKDFLIGAESRLGDNLPLVLEIDH